MQQTELKQHSFYLGLLAENMSRINRLKKTGTRRMNTFLYEKPNNMYMTLKRQISQINIVVR